MRKGLLKASLNRIIDDAGDDIGSPLRISEETLRTYCGAGTGWGKSWNEVKRLLAQWEAKGFLRVLCDPESASPKDICLELLYYIEGTGGHSVYFKKDES